MIYTEYQQVLLTQLQNNDKRIEEIKKEQEEIQGMYNPQNEMFRLLGTKRSFSQNETFFFSHPYPALFRLISHF